MPRPDKGMFSVGQDTLQPNIYQGGIMRPEIREGILEILDAFWKPRYPNWKAWSHVYHAGSGASYWWDSDVDFDVLIGIDKEMLDLDRPQNAPFTEEEVCRTLTAELHRELNPMTANWQGMKTTWFVNPGSYDIRAINPYAAYSITYDKWAVKPVSVPPNWNPDYFPERWWDEAEQIAKDIDLLMSRDDEIERREDAIALFNELKAERQKAYSDWGNGWLDWGNFIYQYLTQTGHLRALYLEKHPEEKTAIRALNPDKEIVHDFGAITDEGQAWADRVGTITFPTSQPAWYNQDVYRAFNFPRKLVEFLDKNDVRIMWYPLNDPSVKDYAREYGPLAYLQASWDFNWNMLTLRTDKDVDPEAVVATVLHEVGHMVQDYRDGDQYPDDWDEYLNNLQGDHTYRLEADAWDIAKALAAQCGISWSRVMSLVHTYGISTYASKEVGPNIIYEVGDDEVFGAPSVFLRGKGTTEVKDWLKDHGFIWNRGQHAYQHHLTSKELKVLVEALTTAGYNVVPQEPKKKKKKKKAVATPPSGTEYVLSEFVDANMHQVRAYINGVHIGSLTFHAFPPHEIYTVMVDTSWQRQGIATEMLRRAREKYPVIHSGELTPDGAEWSRAVAKAVKETATYTHDYCAKCGDVVLKDDAISCVYCNDVYCDICADEVQTCQSDGNELN